MRGVCVGLLLCLSVGLSSQSSGTLSKAELSRVLIEISSELDSIYRQLEESRALSNDTIDSLRNNLQTAKAELKQVRRQLTLALSTLDSSNRQVASLQTEANGLEQSVNDLEQSVRRLERRLNWLKIERWVWLAVGVVVGGGVEYATGAF